METMNLTETTLANLFDHTCLKANAVHADFDKLCEEAMRIGAAMVAINSVPVAYCKALLAQSKVHVGAAIAFPLGQTTIASKVFETQNAIANGADEIDYVINISEAKMGNWDYITQEMKAIVAVCKDGNVISKVIFENCYLNKEEIITLSKIAKEVQPDFIKTSTGLGTSGATLEDVALMKQYAGEHVKIKAAGGIRDWATCKAMIKAGAQRIGTSSGLKILEEFRQEQGQ